MVVPGSIHSPTSAGTNALLRDGARPVLGIEDILESLGEFEPSGSNRASSSEANDMIRPKDPQSVRILEALRHENMDRDSLQSSLEISTRELSLRLVELEISGWVSTDRDGRLCITRARGLAEPPGRNPS